MEHTFIFSLKPPQSRQDILYELFLSDIHIFFQFQFEKLIKYLLDCCSRQQLEIINSYSKIKQTPNNNILNQDSIES